MSLPVQSCQQREQEVTWVLRTRGGRNNYVLQIAFVRILTREFGFVFDVYTAVTQCYITQWIGLLGLCAQRPAWAADSEPAAQRNMHPRWLTSETLLMFLDIICAGFGKLWASRFPCPRAASKNSVLLCWRRADGSLYSSS